MKVLLDSSFLYSAMVHGGKPSKVLKGLVERHTIVISDYIIEEVSRNIVENIGREAASEFQKAFENFISGCVVKGKGEYMQYLSIAMTMISTKDAPVLACALLPDIDLLLTSDKEFLGIELDGISIVVTRDMEQLLELDQ